MFFFFFLNDLNNYSLIKVVDIVKLSAYQLIVAAFYCVATKLFMLCDDLLIATRAIRFLPVLLVMTTVVTNKLYLLPMLKKTTCIRFQLKSLL